MSKNMLIVCLGAPYCETNPELTMSEPIAPYGPLSIASYVNQYSTTNSRVYILDLSVFNYTEDKHLSEIEDKINELNIDIIGFSLMFNNTRKYLKYLTGNIKMKFPKLINIAGGPVANNFSDALMEECIDLDGICFGEGEIPILRVIDAENLMEAIENDISFISRKSLDENRKPVVSFVTNLDEIPFIDFSLIDLEKYIFSSAVSPFKLKGEDYKNGREMWIHTSRGCPYSCVFCAAHSVHGKKMRAMSAKRVIDNIKDMIDKYGMTHVTIQDDQFLLGEKRAKEILRGLVEIKPEISVHFLNLSVFLIDDEMAALIKKLKCPRVIIAIESGSQHVLDNIMHKPVKLDLASKIIKTLHNLDLLVHGLFVIGLPGETDADRDETLKYIYDNNVEWSAFNVAAPFKGSELYEMCIENNYIEIDDAVDAETVDGIINTPEYSGEYITEKVYLMNLEANFVKSALLRSDNTENAINRFKRITVKFPHHAIAFYSLAQAYKRAGDNENYNINMKKYFDIINKDEKWLKYANHFNLETKLN